MMIFLFFLFTKGQESVFYLFYILLLLSNGHRPNSYEAWRSGLAWDVWSALSEEGGPQAILCPIFVLFISSMLC